MVAHPREAPGANRLRSLNQPQPIKVHEDRIGHPLAVIYKNRRIAVTGIKDHWRIDDEWWRHGISRLYYQVVLQDYRILTLFRDLLDGGWFTQSAPVPKSRHENVRAFVGKEKELGKLVILSRSRADRL